MIKRHSDFMKLTPHNPVNYERYLLVLIVCTFLLRFFVMAASPLNLHGDEAQYWAWSQNLDWGYFSKPPLIAWVIAASTMIFGHAEWAIRLPSSFIHCLTAWVIFTTTRRLFDSQTGFWAACLYFLMPAVWLSSTIISTDVPLLLCWALALNAWTALREARSWLRALQLGLAIGFGLLAKYAMLFFLPALLIAVIFDRPTREALWGRAGLIVLLIASIIFSPNLIWNISHDFATVGHTADNANFVGLQLKPAKFLTFFVDQFGVFGPLSFLFLLWAVIQTKLRPQFSRWLWALTLLPLIIISFQALLSRANANWAVTAYIAGPIVLAAIAIHKPKVLKILQYGIIGQSVVMISMGLLLLSPSLANAFGLANSVKRMRGWPETVATLEAIYKDGHQGQKFEAIATDNRRLFYSANYYGLPEISPFYMWRLSSHPGNHADMAYPLPPMEGPVLLINYNKAYIPLFQDDFQNLTALPPIEIELGGGKTRKLRLWAGYKYTPTETHRE